MKTFVGGGSYRHLPLPTSIRVKSSSGRPNSGPARMAVPMSGIRRPRPSTGQYGFVPRRHKSRVRQRCGLNR